MPRARAGIGYAEVMRMAAMLAALAGWMLARAPVAMDAASAAVSAQMMGAAMAAQAAPAAAAQNGAAESSAEAGISSDKVVTSPLVGTFYTPRCLSRKATR